MDDEARPVPPAAPRFRFGRYDSASVPAFSRTAKYHAAVTLFADSLFLFFIVSSALQLR
jgi:hypothetical protein